jgi:excisionase family DNA binding protein
MSSVNNDNALRHCQSTVPNDGILESGFATSVEAAKFLNLSKAMIGKMVADGRIPAQKYGRAVRIPWAWLRNQAQI